jgi:hypothetical protein
MKTYLQKLKTVKQLKFKENTFKIYLKELFFVAYLFCISLIPFNLSGQLVAIFNIFFEFHRYFSVSKEYMQNYMNKFMFTRK